MSNFETLVLGGLGVASLLFSLYQLCVWVGIVRRGVKVRAVVISSIDRNHPSDPPMVKFLLDGEEVTAEFRDSDLNLQLYKGDIVSCVYDPVRKNLEVDDAWRRCAKILLPFFLGLAFVFVGFFLGRG